MNGVVELDLQSAGVEVPVEAFVDRICFQSVREGMPGGTVRDLVSLIGSEEIFSRLLNVASGRIGAGVDGVAPAELSRQETEAVTEVIQIYLMALQLYGSPEVARTWFHSPCEPLGESVPVELLTGSEGRGRVRDALHADLVAESTPEADCAANSETEDAPVCVPEAVAEQGIPVRH